MFKNIFFHILDRLNVKACSLILSGLMISVGVAMCIAELEIVGTIDIKTPFLSGRLDTGSLGLLVIFLGTLLALAVLFHSGVLFAKKGERVELIVGSNRVICENLSFRKIQQISQLFKDSGIATEQQLHLNTSVIQERTTEAVVEIKKEDK